MLLGGLMELREPQLPQRQNFVSHGPLPDCSKDQR